MLYVATLWGIDYDQSGLGYLPTLYLNRATSYRLVAGGSHRITQALYRVIHENGGSVLNPKRIRRIIIEDNTARGVELEDGAIIWADKAIASTINPHQTFLELAGEENTGTEFAERIKNWMWEEHSFLTFHLALDEAPDFTAASADPEINSSLIYILGYETDEELLKDYDTVHKGELAEQASFNCSFPSIHDPSQAPPGRYSGLISRFAPYRLKEGSDRWYNFDFKRDLTEKSLATLQKYASNITRDKVLMTSVSTPLDIENKFPNMREGSFKQGLYHPLQMGYLRPNEECSETRTPVKNLYLAGSSCYPGGCIIWGPSYIAANTIAEDLGVSKWWAEPEIVTRAREKNLL